MKRAILGFMLLPGLLIFKNLMTGEKCYFLSFEHPMINVRQIVDEIESYGFSSAQPFNNITKRYSVIKDPSKTFCDYNSCKMFDMVYVVKSYIANFAQRVAIRKTWGSDKTLRLKTIFVVGYSKDIQKYIDIESNTYQDLLQFTMVDNYQNLVYKTVFSIIWLNDRKIKTHYVHFVDDDRLVNTFLLHKFAVNSITETDTKMIGHQLLLRMPFRDRSSKYYISIDEYPYDFWPPYLIGGTILTNMKVVKKMALGIPYVKIIHMEDAFIGILSKLLHIKVIHNSGFLPYFQSGLLLSNKLSSPDYKSYHVLLENWIEMQTYDLYMLSSSF